MITRVNPSHSFHFLIQALVGGLIGILFSILFVDIFFPGCRNSLVIQNGMVLSDIAVCSKFPEKIFFMISLLFGAIGAYCTTGRRYSLRLIPVMLGLAASIPLLNFFAYRILQKQAHQLVPVMLVCLVMLTATAYMVSAARQAKPVQPIADTHSERWFWWIPFLLTQAVIGLILIPESFTAIAAHIGMETHVISFLIGPALYFLGNHLAPGIDYFTQYSIGLGWLFSHMLGHNVQTAFTNYAYLVIFATWLFYAQVFYLLYWLYKSWVPAATVALLSLILLFVMNVHFVAPSSSVLRYPLLGLCAWLLGKWIARPHSLVWHTALAASIAFSVFFNTETGIIIALAVVISRLLTTQRLRSVILPIITLGISSSLLLVLIMACIFGNVVLQANFYRYLIEPLLIYGKIGFGSYPISWSMNDLNWFYNLAAPYIALVTLALAARSSKAIDADRPRLAVLSFFTLCGLLMMFKYVNRAIVGVWQMSALGLLVPIAWWAYLLVKTLQRSPYNQRTIKGYSINLAKTSASIFIAGAVWLAALSGDVRNPTQYGLQSWFTYPAWISSSFPFMKPTGCFSYDCVLHQPAENDVQLIKERTVKGEQVAIIDNYDWTYLVNAHRPPLMFFTPSGFLFTERLIQESVTRLKTAKYLFLPKGKKKGEPEIAGAMNDILSPTFHQVYEYDGEGDKLVAWRRKQVKVK